MNRKSSFGDWFEGTQSRSPANKKHLYEWVKIWITYLQSVFLPQTDRRNRSPVYKAWSVGGPTEAFHVPLHTLCRMCARLDFYKQFTDKVPNSCSPPDNWLGKQRRDWRWKVLEKPKDPTSSQHSKNVFQLFHKNTIYSVVGTDPFLFILKTQQKLNREMIIFF